MSILFVIVPTTAFMVGLVLYFLYWTHRTGQYEDLEGAASRILHDDWNESPGIPARNECPK